jgi:aryl-alcohol dehydrogenase-like predicted oxidoreductase
VTYQILIWGYALQAALQEIFDAAVQGGINFFDTAEVRLQDRSNLSLFAAG